MRQTWEKILIEEGLSPDQARAIVAHPKLLPGGSVGSRHDGGVPLHSCEVCGKVVAVARYGVTVVGSGSRFQMAGEREHTYEEGNCGGFQVGPACARKLRKIGVMVHDWAEQRQAP